MREVDLAIVGAGVAGLTAATDAARAGLSVLVVERMGAGGQVMTVESIANFPGHEEGISGFELGPLLQEEAENAGAEFMLDTVLSVQPELSEGLRVLKCEGEDIAARAVLIACGSQRRALGVPGEEEFEGRGISHCASCDGPLFRGQSVVVAGGGDSAVGEALVLAAHADSVHLVFPEAQPHAQAYLLDAVRAQPKVQLHADARVAAIEGNTGGVTGVQLKSFAGEARTLPAHGVFVYAGLLAATGFLGGQLRSDLHSRILTDASLATSMDGVFAAGDVRAGCDYTLAAAARDGRQAARSIASFLRQTTET